MIWNREDLINPFTIGHGTEICIQVDFINAFTTG